MPNEQPHRVRILDIAEELGVSTATVSNVIHGKTKKISDETVRRVQQLLEEKQYIPNMAAVLLAQNSSKLICVVVSDDVKYENQTLHDPFLSALIGSLATEIDAYGYFMMLKKTSDPNTLAQYASMWNMAGLILLGFCEQDYDHLRSQMRIPFVTLDGYQPHTADRTAHGRYANIAIDDFDGGYQMGRHLIQNGHRRIVFLADNDICMDHDRLLGLRQAAREYGLDEQDVSLALLPVRQSERLACYLPLRASRPDATAFFCASDAYAIELLNALQDDGRRVPDTVSVAGFDDIPAAALVRPALTTIRQDTAKRAAYAVQLLNCLIQGEREVSDVVLPVELMVRGSVRTLR